MNRYINIAGGLTLWLVCILILVDPTGWIAKQTPYVGVPILLSAGVMWWTGSWLIDKEIGQDVEGNE